MEQPAEGRIQAIYLRPSSRTPVKKVSRAQAQPGEGLVGDHAPGGKREITLFDTAAWRLACDSLGVDVDPGARRANLFVDGIPLAATIGSRLRIGDCVIEILGELAPCRLMDDTAAGLMDALRPDGRGGVHGRVLDGGVLTIGDTVELEDQ